MTATNEPLETNFDKARMKKFIEELVEKGRLDKNKRAESYAIEMEQVLVVGASAPKKKVIVWREKAIRKMTT